MSLDNVKIYSQGGLWMEQQLTEDPMAFFEYIDTFMERHLTSSDTNIPRHVFLKWNRSGLLPNQSDDEAGWRRFSFVEYFWLKMVQKMEELNIPVKTMQRVKQGLFTLEIDDFVNVFSQSMEQFSGKEQMFKNLPQEAVEILKDASRWKTIFREMVKEITPFMFLFMELMRRPNMAALVIGMDGDCEFICFNEINEKGKLQNIPQIFSQSFYSINLNQLLSDFYISKKVELEYYKTVELLNDNEVEIIKAVRTLGIKELTIKFDKNHNVILIEKVSTRDSKKLQDKVNSLVRKGVVTDIRMVFDEHGTLRLYQEKEQTKLINTISKK